MKINVKYSPSTFYLKGHKAICEICKANRANAEYFDMYGSWSPFLTTSSKCEDF